MASAMSKAAAGVTLTQMKTQLIELMLDYGVLKFGDFTLKSGRRSPYFFNLGVIADGEGLLALGRAYADALVRHQLLPDVLLGPAYKGIPLATAAAMALTQHYQMNVGVAFNRKEAKQHGEGGSLIGHPLQGRVVIVDDVMTAGTAVNQALALMGGSQADARLAGVLLAMDRQELMPDGRTALAGIAQDRGISVHSILCLQDLITYLEDRPSYRVELGLMRNYQRQHCLVTA